MNSRLLRMYVSNSVTAVGNLLRSGRTGLNQTQLHQQVAEPLEGFLRVPVPQQMLHAVQTLRYISSGLWLFFLQCLCLLLQHSQPHRDVEPVDQMFAERMQILLYPAHIFAAVGHEHDLLVLLHPL